MSSFEEDFDKNVSFIFISFLIAIRWDVSFLIDQTKLTICPRKNRFEIQREILLEYEFTSVDPE